MLFGSLKERFGYVNVVMIGDGATDMQVSRVFEWLETRRHRRFISILFDNSFSSQQQARPPADAFIGYGGVVVREAVAKGADWYVHSFDELIKVVKK